MTGSAQHSSTATIFQRPRTVRRPASAPPRAPRGVGRECTVSPSGSSAAAAGSDELEPDIKDGQEGREAEPLEGIAVVLLDAERRGRPFALKPFRRAAHLLQRDV